MPATIPESTKTSLQQRLTARAQERWPALTKVQVRFRGRFAYVDAALDSGEVLALCRLRYAGSATLWGFAIYLASKDARLSHYAAAEAQALCTAVICSRVG
jgi:hypothetical protein